MSTVIDLPTRLTQAHRLADCLSQRIGDDLSDFRLHELHKVDPSTAIVYTEGCPCNCEDRAHRLQRLSGRDDQEAQREREQIKREILAQPNPFTDNYTPGGAA